MWAHAIGMRRDGNQCDLPMLHCFRKEGGPPPAESLPGDPNPPAQQQDRQASRAQLYSAPSMYYTRALGRSTGPYTSPSGQGCRESVRIVSESETNPQATGAQPYMGTIADLRGSKRGNSRDVEDSHLLDYPRRTQQRGFGAPVDYYPPIQHMHHPDVLR